MTNITILFVFITLVHSVCLAGRETRFSDPVYENLADVLNDVTSAVYDVCKGTPFALLGHRFGHL